jgi:PadR family transcriptional regulator, regulatory protein PadR
MAGTRRESGKSGRSFAPQAGSKTRPRSKKSLTSYTVWDIVCTVHCMANGTPSPELFESLRLELRRGCLIVAVLAQLRTEQYGYTLRKALADDGLAIDEGTLYPLLRRLETQGLLVSQWREEDKRNKRFYRLSAQGEEILGQLLDEWERINASLDRILQEAGRI